MIPLETFLSDNLTSIIVGLIAAGVLSYARDAWKYLAARRKRRTPEGQEAERQRVEQVRVNDAVEAANNSVVVAVKSNAMLAADAERYRREIDTINARHDLERAAWQRETEALKTEHALERARLEGREVALRAELESMEARLRQALEDLMEVRRTFESSMTPDN